MKIEEFVEVVADKFNVIKPFFVSTKTRNINEINTVVLHWTAGSNLTSDIKTLKSKNYGYHFLIDKGGNIYQGAALNKVVSHGGNSYGPNGEFVNGHSIAISFSMRGILSDGSEDTYTDEMYNSCIALIKNIKSGIPSLKYVTGHHWVSPGRKIDPYTFDFSRLMGSLGPSYTLWKTGNGPFPSGLDDCKCVEFYSNGNCKKSVGRCKGAGGYGYSERNLSTKVSSTSFQSDLDTD